MPAHRLRRSVVLGLGAVLLLASTALADDKPKIAVLGLEVQAAGGAPDQETTKIARNLTDGLRQRALSGSGQYTMAPNSERELIDEKLMASCLDEAPKCMAQIGAGLKADFLLYGRVDKTKEKDCEYRITLRLLDVAKATEPASSKHCISAATATGNPKQWGEKTYTKVVGDDSGSSAGTSTATTTTVVTPPPSTPKKSNGWKKAAYVSGSIAIISGAAYAVAGGSYLLAGGGDKCAPEDQKQTKWVCRNGETLTSTANVVGPMAAAAAVFTGVAWYMSSRSKERSTVAGKPAKKNFVVTPVVTPDGGGATVRFDW
jgi:hypothetical protein